MTIYDGTHTPNRVISFFPKIQLTYVVLVCHATLLYTYQAGLSKAQLTHLRNATLLFVVAAVGTWAHCTKNQAGFRETTNLVQLALLIAPYLLVVGQTTRDLYAWTQGKSFDRFDQVVEWDTKSEALVWKGPSPWLAFLVRGILVFSLYDLTLWLIREGTQYEVFWGIVRAGADRTWRPKSPNYVRRENGGQVVPEKRGLWVRNNIDFSTV